MLCLAASPGEIHGKCRKPMENVGKSMKQILTSSTCMYIYIYIVGYYRFFQYRWMESNGNKHGRAQNPNVW